MWKRIDSPDLAETYRREFLPGATPEPIAKVLAGLSKTSFASEIYATSMNKLRLIAREFHEARPDAPELWILQKDDRFVVSYAYENQIGEMRSVACSELELESEVLVGIACHLLG